MVKSVSKGGLHDWIAQRATAIIIGAYAIFLFAFLVVSGHQTYQAIHLLFSHIAMRVATIIAMLCVLWHAWIGLWTVFTDYVKCRFIRLILEFLVVLLMLGYLVWLVEIFYR